MREEDTYCHLGVPTRFNKPRNPGEAIKGIKEDVEKINNSLLTTWQKIDATKTFVYTRLDFILRGSLIHKTSFREVDLLIKRLGKKWPGLPLQASNEVLFIPPSKGGAGIHFYTTLSHIYIRYVPGILHPSVQGGLRTAGVCDQMLYTYMDERMEEK
ncbi:hypothetical protein LAZ67_1008430 [Cordylochernes scorpioides]|uniref:Uncharacterized protein n=1 Tax=Cordylochernes scorpioides TaxID=51811 RepID=A0ABY6K1V6_9ARAC|nr:hypothetical protein LAZ67_1008430 [Cordylochernes scorpioides]